MLFHDKTKKFVRVMSFVIGILVIVSMIIAYAPFWRT
jgi:hypothetical protein